MSQSILFSGSHQPLAQPITQPAINSLRPAVKFQASIMNTEVSPVAERFEGLKAHLPVEQQGTLTDLLQAYIGVTRRGYEDKLTGLFNRGYFENQLAEEFTSEKNQGGKLGLIVIDMDRFKPINDQFGHVYGDTALKTVAKALKKHCDLKDVYPCRIGGDEFAVIIGNAGSASFVEETAQLIRDEIINSEFKVPAGEDDAMAQWNLASTISGGFIDFSEDSEHFSDEMSFFNAVDQNLINVKEKGRQIEKRAIAKQKTPPDSTRNLVVTQTFSDTEAKAKVIKNKKPI